MTLAGFFFAGAVYGPGHVGRDPIGGWSRLDKVPLPGKNPVDFNLASYLNAERTLGLHLLITYSDIGIVMCGVVTVSFPCKISEV